MAQIGCRVTGTIPWIHMDPFQPIWSHGDPKSTHFHVFGPVPRYRPLLVLVVSYWPCGFLLACRCGPVGLNLVWDHSWLSLAAAETFVAQGCSDLSPRAIGQFGSSYPNALE